MTASICLVGISAGASAMPVTIDFEVGPVDNAPSYTESGVTFTATAPGTLLRVFDLAQSDRSINAGPSPFVPLRADIAGGASMVSILVGDGSPDTDDIFLRAFSALDVQIAEDTFFLSSNGFTNLTVSAANIAYVLIGATSSVGANSIVTDEFTFTREVLEIPESGALAIFGLGLAGLGFARLKRAV